MTKSLVAVEWSGLRTRDIDGVQPGAALVSTTLSSSSCLAMRAFFAGDVDSERGLFFGS